MGFGYFIFLVNKYIFRIFFFWKKYFDLYLICIIMGSIYFFNVIFVFVKMDIGVVKRFGLGVMNKLFFLFICRYVVK